MHLFLTINYSHRERCYWFDIMNDFWSAGHTVFCFIKLFWTFLASQNLFFFLCPSPSPFGNSHLSLLNHQTLCSSMKADTLNKEKKSVKSKNCFNCYFFTDTHFLQWCMSSVGWAIVFYSIKKRPPTRFQVQYPFTLQVFLNHATQTHRT